LGTVGEPIGDFPIVLARWVFRSRSRGVPLRLAPVTIPTNPLAAAAILA
jgi:hypothetical protein